MNNKMEEKAVSPANKLDTTIIIDPLNVSAFTPMKKEQNSGLGVSALLSHNTSKTHLIRVNEFIR